MTTIRVDDCSFQSYQNLEGAVLSISYCQQLKLKLLSMVAFKDAKFLPTVGADIPVSCSFHSFQNPVNGGS